jgi:pyroglutamyl-peptidase
MTRQYPVEFSVARKCLERDLHAYEFDYALHVGQAERADGVQLEAIAVNVAGESEQLPEEFKSLIPGGPVAYRTDLPLANWARQLRDAGIPATVAYHAGTYLCNALLYLSVHFAQTLQVPTRATFVHLPLATSQGMNDGKGRPSLPSDIAAAALRMILQDLV